MLRNADVRAIAAAGGIEGIETLQDLFDRARGGGFSTDVALALALVRYIRDVRGLEQTAQRCRRRSATVVPFRPRIE